MPRAEFPYIPVMRLPGLIERRLRKGPQRMAEYHIEARFCVAEDVSRDELESATEQVLDLLLEDASVLGPAAACDFGSDAAIEVEFAIRAASLEDLHRRVGHLLSLLEARGAFQYHDSTTSRADKREPVPA